MWTPDYKLRYGFAVWIGLSIVDFISVQSGFISLLGFLVAFVWAQGGMQLTPGPVKGPGDNEGE